MSTETYISRRELQETKEEIKAVWRGLLVAFLVSHPSAAEAIATVFRQETGMAREEVPPLAPVVLMVDGDPVSSQNVASGLIEAGFEVVSASDCAEALARLSDIELAMVILDEALPESEELASQIRDGSDIPIILVGTSSPDKGWEIAAALGADAYLRRTTSKSEFIARVRAMLRRYLQEQGGQRQ